MKNLKICFLDCNNPNLPNFNTDNIFLYQLRKEYNVEICAINPDIIFYPLSYNNHFNYKNCIKVFFTEEPGHWNKYNYMNFYPLKDRCYLSMFDADYVLSSYYLSNDKNIRFPSYMHYAYQMTLDGRLSSLEDFIKPKTYTKDNIKNKKFCCFMYRNKHAEKRVTFLKKLSNYKQVDIINIGGNSYEKCDYIKNYKFTFAFENSGILLTKNDLNNFDDYHQNYLNQGQHTMKNDNIGYTTEKIIEPISTETIPLYWGNPIIHMDFSIKRFVSWHNYNNDEKMIEKIIELDNDDNKYLEMLNQPVISDYENSYFNLDKSLSFLKNILV
jgi:hypothetical protein